MEPRRIGADAEGREGTEDGLLESRAAATGVEVIDPQVPPGTGVQRVEAARQRGEQ
jgi:hypothetical protein